MVHYAFVIVASIVVSHANFTNACLDGSNLVGATIDGAIFTGTTFVGTVSGRVVSVSPKFDQGRAVIMGYIMAPGVDLRQAVFSFLLV